MDLTSWQFSAWIYGVPISQRVLNDFWRTSLSCGPMIWLLSHPLHLPVPLASSLPFSVFLYVAGRLLTGETRGRGWRSLVLYKAINTLCFTWTSLKAWMRVSPSSSPLHSHWCSELYTCIWQFTVQWPVHLDMTIYSAVSCLYLDMTIHSAVSCTPGYDSLQCSELYTWILQFTVKWAVHLDVTIYSAVSCTPGYDSLHCSELYTWIWQFTVQWDVH